MERQIRVHVELAQWQPDVHAAEATPECWRRAYAIAHLRREGVTDAAEIARRINATLVEVDEDSRLVPYLDRTVAGLLAVLGWYVDSNV